MAESPSQELVERCADLQRRLDQSELEVVRLVQESRIGALQLLLAVEREQRHVQILEAAMEACGMEYHCTDCALDYVYYILEGNLHA